MKEILITSSVMILVVIALRFVFRKRVSRRVIYGAWLLVALRLLIPIQFGQLDFSVLTQAEPVTEVITEIAQKPISGPSREELYNDALREQISQGTPVFIPEIQEQVDTEIQHSGRPAPEVYDEFLEANKAEEILIPEVNQQIEATVSEKAAPSLGQIALWVWLAGIFGMACWFIGVNVSLRHSLHLSTVDFPAESLIPVKVSLILSSPCLFGLFRPTIYLTPACTEDDRHLRHVLIHEQTHLRHCDHIWAWVRCLCLCIYWFDPLVWVAAYLSKRDCELACDEAALKILGEEERLAYGRTLVDMVASNPAPGQLLETATAMHETKKQLKERVNRIVKKPKLFLTAAIALLLVLSIVTGCAFTGPVTRSAGTPDSTTPTTVPNNPTTLPTDPTTVPTTPTTAPNDPTTVPTVPTTPITVPTDPPEPTEPPLMVEMRSLLSSGWFNQALTSTYSHAFGVDLYEFFHNGFPEESKEPTAEEWAQLKNIPGFKEGLDLIRLPASKMNEIFLEYFNEQGSNIYTIRSSNESLKKLTYLESTDCYYFMRADTDTNAVTNFTITRTRWTMDDYIYVYYTRDDSHHKYCLRLKYDDGNYCIVSNTFALDDAFESVFASLPEPENYHYIFEVVLHNYESAESAELAKFILDLFLKDPDTFVKYIALEQKGTYKPAHCISLVLRQARGTEELKQFIAACKRIAEDPASTPDEQYAAFMMIWDKIGQAGELAYTLQALEKRTPLDDYTVDTCLVKLNINGGYAPQNGTNAWIYSTYKDFQNMLADHKAHEYFYTNVTNTLCPESYDQLVSAYDAAFFEKNVLIRTEVRSNKDALPVLTKVTAGEQSYWTSPFSLYLEYDEANREEFMVYILFIAIPREHYQPYLEEESHHVDFIINGEPRLPC